MQEDKRICGFMDKKHLKVTYLAKMCPGGVKTHVNSLAESLTKKHEVKIIASEDMSSFRISYFYYFDNPLMLKRIKEEIRNCDIFHIHHPCSSSELFLPWLYKKIHGDAKIVNTFHTQVSNGVFRIMGKNYIKFLSKIYSDVSKIYLCVSDYQKKIIEETTNGKNKATVINNGVDIKKFRKKKSERFFEGFTLGYLGRLDYEKNIINLVKACKELKINIVIGGKGVLYQQVKGFESENIKVLGWVRESEKSDFYNSIDTFISPSYAEACIPITSLEAMACNKPVILSGCGGQENKIVGENAGIICKPDADSIKNAIKRIMHKDMEELGRNARRLVVKEHNKENTLKQIEKVYKQTI